MRVLVTGANGFLGRYVVAYLLSQNYQVRTFIRSKQSIEHFPWKNKVEVFEGDLRSQSNLLSAFSNVDALIHLAASKTGDEDAQFDATVVGTERLLEAMQKSKAIRLILVSSISVYDYQNLGKELNEESTIETNLYKRDGYAITKMWQERVTRKISQAAGWDLTVLRPGMIWGERQEYPQVLSIPAGMFHFVIAPSKSPNLVHVKRCAQAVVETLKNPETIGQTINIIDNANSNAWEFMGKFLRFSHTPGIRIPVPYFLALPVIKAVNAISLLILREHCKIPSIFIPCRFEARFKPFSANNTRAEELINWNPQEDNQSFFENLGESKKYE
jgi:nucleoside-diphosphate-sugar epimerase